MMKIICHKNCVLSKEVYDNLDKVRKLTLEILKKTEEQKHVPIRKDLKKQT